jgi:hypothetical protein
MGMRVFLRPDVSQKIIEDLKGFKGEGITKFIKDLSNKYNVQFGAVHNIYYTKVKKAISLEKEKIIINDKPKVNPNEIFLIQICKEIEKFLKTGSLSEKAVSEIEKMLEQDGVVTLSRKLQRLFSIFNSSPRYKEFLEKLKTTEIDHKILKPTLMIEPDLELLSQEIKFIIESYFNNVKMLVVEEKTLKEIIKTYGIINVSRKVERLLASNININNEDCFIDQLKQVGL